MPMKLLNESKEKELSQVFDTMHDPINVILFTTKENCDTCEQTQSFMEELNNVGQKINFIHYDIDVDTDMTKKYDIHLTPSVILENPKDGYKGIKFSGIPAGHEVNSLISGILEVSGVNEILPESTLERIKKVDQPVHIKVFVTLSCPHCPGAVQKAHKLALLNENITSEMIESQTFLELARKNKVMSVPRLIINDKEDVMGNQPLDIILDAIEKALM